MEETFSSLVHPLLPPLSILSPSPRAARTPDREPRAPPAPRGAPLARGCVSPATGTRSSKHLSAAAALRAGCRWEADAHPVGPR